MNVPGVCIPDSVIFRLQGVHDQRREGIAICIEPMQEISEIEGGSGLHIMAYRRERSIGEIVQGSGGLDGRTPFNPQPFYSTLSQRDAQ